MRLTPVTVVPVVLYSLLLLSEARPISFLADVRESAKPPYTEYAQMCRWLVHQNSWGVLAVISSSGQPISGALSFSDGPDSNPTGRIIFFMTPMDELTTSITANPKASFTVSEAQLHPYGCGATDPEDPTCARVSILGDVVAVPEEGQEEAFQLLLSRHPDMASWPAGHQFKLYELQVGSLHLLDWYGGMHTITAEQYFSTAFQASHSKPLLPGNERVETAH